MPFADKVEQLHRILLDYRRVAVAFSGGVDSSLLLKVTLDTLGAGNVLGLFGRSCLLTEEEQQRAESWPVRHGFSEGLELTFVDTQPLFWKEFVRNSEDRCYLCKLRMYRRFTEEMEKRDIHVLLDGTNTDDLKDRRPGLRAIHELGVKTPFVEAGFDKQDIRLYSRQLKLDTWQSPSLSCLATRIPHGLEITEDRLQKIAFWEAELTQMGFNGCRVRMVPVKEEAVYIQLQHKQFKQFLEQGMRVAVLRFFQKNGIAEIYLDIAGR